MLLFLNPVRDNKTNYLMLDRVQEAILKNLSIEVKYVPLVIKSSVTLPSGCFTVNNSFNLSSSIIVKNSSSIVKSSMIGNDIYIETTSPEKLYNFYSSTRFNYYPLSSSCIPLNPGDYSYGILVNQQRILFENMVKLNQDYLSNYGSLKNDLGLSYNFDFALYFLNRTVLLNDTLGVHKFSGRDILAREIPLKIINKNATDMDVIMLLRTWN